MPEGADGIAWLTRARHNITLYRGRAFFWTSSNPGTNRIRLGRKSNRNTLPYHSVRRCWNPILPPCTTGFFLSPIRRRLVAMQTLKRLVLPAYLLVLLVSEGNNQAAAEDIFLEIDADGVPSYSDQNTPGSSPVDVRPVTPYSDPNPQHRPDRSEPAKSPATSSRTVPPSTRSSR